MSKSNEAALNAIALEKAFFVGRYELEVFGIAGVLPEYSCG